MGYGNSIFTDSFIGSDLVTQAPAIVVRENRMLTDEEVLGMMAHYSAEGDALETEYTEPQVTELIRENHPEYTPDVEKIRHDKENIPKMRETIAKTVKEYHVPSYAKLTQSKSNFQYRRQEEAMFAYANKFLGDETRAEMDRLSRMVDEFSPSLAEYNNLGALVANYDKRRSDNEKEAKKAESTAKSLFQPSKKDTPLTAKAKTLSGEEQEKFIREEYQGLKGKLEEILTLKNKISVDAANHLMDHIDDVNPVLGETLAETVQYGISTSDDAIRKYPEYYIKSQAIGELEGYLGGLKDEKYAATREKFQEVKSSVYGIMSYQLLANYKFSSYASAAAGFLDVSACSVIGSLEDRNDPELRAIADAHPSVNSVFGLAGLYASSISTAANDHFGRSCVYFTEDGKNYTSSELSDPEAMKDILADGKMLYAMPKDDNNALPFPICYRDGKVLTGDRISKVGMPEMPEKPEMDPSIQPETGRWNRFKGFFSNSLKSDKQKAYEAEKARFNAAMEKYNKDKAEYDKAVNQADKSSPEALSEARRGFNTRRLHNMSKEDREAENSRLFEEAEKELNEERAAREAAAAGEKKPEEVKQPENGKAPEKQEGAEAPSVEKVKTDEELYNADRILAGFSKLFPDGNCPEQLIKNVRDVSENALNAQRELTSKLNTENMIKGSDIGENIKDLTIYSEMSKAAESGNVSPEKLSFYGDPAFIPVAKSMMDINKAVGYMVNSSHAPSAFAPDLLKEKTDSIGSAFSDQIDKAIRTSKEHQEREAVQNGPSLEKPAEEKKLVQEVPAAKGPSMG